MNLRNLRLSVIGRFFLFAAETGLFVGAALEFYNVAWGTGKLWGDFSLKWGMAFILFVIFSMLCLLATGSVLWKKQKTEPFLRQLAILRERMGRFYLLAAFVVLILPIWLFQYSPWGVVFSKLFIRLLVWFFSILFVAFFITREPYIVLSWPGILTGSLLCGAGFVLTNPFGGVTSYPFSLGWSEGNRIWDYSLLFGKHLYNYSPEDPPTAYLDLGRQLVGGLPFLLPQVSLGIERSWIALMEILPYLMLGWLAFRPEKSNGKFVWILAGVWGLMFLNQGPIHAPLLVCAILVAMAWRQPLWVAVPLVAVAGYFAQLSRFTYIFAPAMWAVMLEFGGAVVDKDHVRPRDWGRTVSVGLAGLLGAFLSTKLILPINNNVPIPASNATGTAVVDSAVGTAVVNGTVGAVATNATPAAFSQPLLWYRLFPNATYGYGILVGLMIAVGPLIIILFFLAVHHWKLNLLQKLALLMPLSAFLVVGLIISTKIGGGGDLHNMDMFLIAMLFSAALAWKSVGAQWVAALQKETVWMQTAVLLLIAIPAFQPLMSLRPLSFENDASWLAVLTHVTKPKDLGSLPSDHAITTDLLELREAVKTAQSQGEVLFMDQRQLLTFGYIKDVPLVSEYEKKLMMDEALSSNNTYFQPFYADLAAHRFSLIISDPLRTPIKDSEYGFGEENNAWVKWIAKPVLCYYEEKDTLMDVRVEMLVPRQGSYDCSNVLP